MLRVSEVYEAPHIFSIFGVEVDHWVIGYGFRVRERGIVGGERDANVRGGRRRRRLVDARRLAAGFFRVFWFSSFSEEEEDGNDERVRELERVKMAASFRWVLQLHKDVPKAARFYSEGLDFTINVCTHRWAELQSGPLKLALMHSSTDIVVQKGYSSLLSFTVGNINNSVTKLLALGAELDGPIKYEIHGKVAALRCVDGHMLGLYEPS